MITTKVSSQRALTKLASEYKKLGYAVYRIERRRDGTIKVSFKCLRKQAQFNAQTEL